MQFMWGEIKPQGNFLLKVKCPVLYYQLFHLLYYTSAWGGFVFLPRSLLFTKVQKTVRNDSCTTQRPLPVKRFGCPLTPGVPPLHLATIAACMPHSFSASSLTSVYRHECRASWSLCSLFLSPSKGSDQCVLIQHQDHSSHCLGLLPRLSFETSIYSELPSLLLLLYSRLSNTCIFAPFFPTLRRRQFS